MKGENNSEVIMIAEAAKGFGEAVKVEMSQRMKEAGHDGYRQSLFPVYKMLSEGPKRLTELAQINGNTQQAIGKLCKELSVRGDVSRVIDSTDKRAKILSLTDKGVKVAQDAVFIAGNVAGEWSKVLDKNNIAFGDFMRALEEIIRITK